MMVVVSIIQHAWKDSWVSIALLWSIRKFRTVFLRLWRSLPSGFLILRGIEDILYLNPSFKSISLPRMTPNACLSFFITDIALAVFFLLLMPRAICNSQLVKKNPLFLWQIFLWQSWDIFHSQYSQHLTNFQLYLWEVLGCCLRAFTFDTCNLLAPRCTLYDKN